MRFVLVNARTPRPQSFCAMCNQPIETSYLREVGTNLIYCDHDCFAEQGVVALFESHARAVANLT